MEFGLISLPFFALLGGIIQIAFVIWAAQNLDFMLQKTAREIFTGTFQTQNAGVTDSSTLLTKLKAIMCQSGRATVFDCSSVKLDVVLGSSLGTSVATSPLDPITKDWSSGFGSNYSCAAPGKIVVIRAAVKFPVFFTLMASGLQNFADGSKLLQSTLVFRTEPYTTTSTC
ncbi:pilus assembly protein [Lichenihabitans sp. Uapishka_5]|uniref:TadE family protein n=1 Tax=Lichenihabitans sp. Uapishka_5 TaxID=3037302 RepID=UPI0029E80F0A|nr:TadE family protein [Lichenihabitans sp. Uapishka_5]MDX7951048.1 pilus assembly protein [Lichenihabitans sp. Uapishka_5]